MTPTRASCLPHTTHDDQLFRSKCAPAPREVLAYSRPGRARVLPFAFPARACRLSTIHRREIQVYSQQVELSTWKWV